jgi:hypothetical protein
MVILRQLNYTLAVRPLLTVFLDRADVERFTKSELDLRLNEVVGGQQGLEDVLVQLLQELDSTSRIPEFFKKLLTAFPGRNDLPDLVCARWSIRPGAAFFGRSRPPARWTTPSLFTPPITEK